MSAMDVIESSADDMSESEIYNTPPKKQEKKSNDKRKKYDTKQKFRKEWCLQEDLKDWLVPAPNDIYKAKCKLCNIEMTSEIFIINRHGKTFKHKQNISLLQKQDTVKKFFMIGNTNNEAESERIRSLETKVKLAEMKLTAFGAENDICFNAIGKLPALLKEIFDDADARHIATHINFERKKATRIVT